MVSRDPKVFPIASLFINHGSKNSYLSFAGKKSLWWELLVKLKYIDEENITWKKFKKYFQQEYLSEKYYDNKMEEFFELKLGNLTMGAYEKRFI